MQSARKANIFLWFIPTLLCASTAMITLSSCAKESSKPSFLSSQIDVGDGSKFGEDDNFSIKSIATRALQNKDGYNSLLRWKIGLALQEWFKNNKSEAYRDEYKKIVEQVDKDWEEKITSAKDSYRNWWESNLRESLDNDGAKDVKAWKTAQINKKVIDKFATDAFGVDYLGIKPSTSEVKLDKRTVAYDYLNDTGHWKDFGFYADKADLDSTNGLNKEVADTYASFQNEVFDQWVKKTLPILTCSVLYKNSQPRNGLGTIFNRDTYSSESGMSLSSSYQFQAFADAKEGEHKLTSNANELFAKFCDELSNNRDTYYNEKTGAVNFRAKWTEDSASGILVNTSSMYKDLFLPYAAGTAYLLMNAVDGIEHNESILSQGWDKIKTSESGGSGNILSKFIVDSSTSDAKNQPYQPQWGFDISKEFNEIFSDNIDVAYDFYVKLAEDKYRIVDMFNCDVPKSKNGQLNLPLMFLRDGPQSGSGIHILTIDGLSYFVNGNNIDLGKLKEFLLFRSLQKVCGDGGYKTPEVGGNNVDFDAGKKIKDYFDSNDDVKLNLITDFLKKQINVNDSSFLKAVDDKSQKALTDSLNVLNEEKFNALYEAWKHCEEADRLVNERKEIRSKIVSNAKTFIDNIKDDKALANGIAGRLPFQINYDTGEVKVLEKFYEFYTGNKTWWSLENSSQGTDLKNASQSIEAETESVASTLIDIYITSLNLQKASKLDYSGYTQCIYTDDDAINSAINTILTASNSNNTISDDYKHAVIETAVKNLKVLKYTNDVEHGKCSLGFADNVPIGNIVKETCDKSLMNTVINSYYLKNIFLNKLSDRSIINSGLPKDDFSSLRNDLETKFNEKFKSDTQFATNYLLFVNTLDYLLSPVSGQEEKNNDSKEINLTTYLKQNISFGTPAYVAWFVGAPMEKNPSEFDSSDGQTPKGYSDKNIATRFNTKGDKSESTNIDYAFGTPKNYLNLNKEIKDPDLYLTDSFYRSVNIKDNGNDESNYHGFCGLITDSSSSTLPSKLNSTIFDSLNFKKVGQLYAYAYGSGEGKTKKLDEYIDNFQTISQLQTFATKLQKAGIKVEEILHPATDAKLDDLKQKLKTVCDSSQDVGTYFKKATGTVAQDKFIENGVTSNDSYSPIEDDSKDKLGYFAYLSQINYYDVVGTTDSNGKKDGGVTSDFLKDGKYRLGLSLEAFLGIAADYAMNNSSAQQAALDRVVTDKDGKKNRVQVYDQRLMKLVTSQWVFTKPKEKK